MCVYNYYVYYYNKIIRVTLENNKQKNNVIFFPALAQTAVGFQRRLIK